jgi:hypothetical protein
LGDPIGDPGEARNEMRGPLECRQVCRVCADVTGTILQYGNRVEVFVEIF